MPQGDRTPRETVEFQHMLAHVNLLYLGMSVLILLDLSYISRFWTQFECWCSMQLLSVSGLCPAPEHERRCTIVPILGANLSLVESLVSMWGNRRPAQAHELLRADDVIVTNQSDKLNQLPKILKLDEEVRNVLGGHATAAPKPAPEPVSSPEAGAGAVPAPARRHSVERAPCHKGPDGRRGSFVAVDRV